MIIMFTEVNDDNVRVNDLVQNVNIHIVSSVAQRYIYNYKYRLNVLPY